MYVREELPEPTQRVEEAAQSVRELGRGFATDSTSYDDLAQAAGELEDAAKWLREECESKADEADPEVD